MSRLRIPNENPPSCGIAAVCALTGKEPGEVIKAISDLVAKSGRVVERTDSFSRKDVMETLMSFGVKFFSRNGSPVTERNIAPAQFSQSDWGGRPTIREFVLANREPDLLFVVGYTDNPDEVSHTFVVDGQDYYDHNTNGQIVGPSGIPDGGLERYRVGIWYRVRIPRS